VWIIILWQTLLYEKKGSAPLLSLPRYLCLYYVPVDSIIITGFFLDKKINDFYLFSHPMLAGKSKIHHYLVEPT
jgi:hypothetical protein